MLAALHDCFNLVTKHHGEHWTMFLDPAGGPGRLPDAGRGGHGGRVPGGVPGADGHLPRLRPQQFYDLVIQVALIRPGPIQGGSVHPYLRRHDGLEDAAMPHESMRPALGKTLGVPLFQEQMMQLAIDCAGFAPDEADRLRQAMSAKRAPERIEELRQRLLDGMAERGIGPAVAEDIYAKILAFSNYGFPESHAISFAYLVYASAWLKRYYPAAFTAALLRNQPMGFYAPHSLINDARRHGVTVRGVDVNASDALATLEEPGPAGQTGPAIRLGLSAVRNLGTAAAERVAAGRPYRDLEDFATRTRLPAAALEALATAGAFGCFGLSRRAALWAAGAAASLREGQLPGTATGMTAPPLPAMTPAEETLADLWATSTYGTHPVAHIRPALDARQVLTAEAVKSGSADDGAYVAVAGLVTHRQRPSTARGVVFLSLEDETGMVNVICLPPVWERHQPTATVAPALLIWGRVERVGGDRQPGRRHAAPAPGRGVHHRGRHRGQPRFPLITGPRTRSHVRAPVSAHPARAELHADPRSDRLGRLRHGVLPGALAAAAHDQQVAVTDLEPQRRATAPRAQQQRPRRAQRHDGDHGVLGPAAPDRVAVPGHAVPSVPVQAQARGPERLAELRAVVRVERLPRGGQHRVGQRRVLAVEAEQPGDRHHLVVHVPLLGPPRHRLQQPAEHRARPRRPSGPQVHPGAAAQRRPPHRAAERTERRFVGHSRAGIPGPRRLSAHLTKRIFED